MTAFEEAFRQAVRDITDERLGELGLTRQPSVTQAAQQPAISGGIHRHCFKCGKEGIDKHTHAGDVFFSCSDEACGYITRDGKFIRSGWDETNWQERRERVEKFASR